MRHFNNSDFAPFQKHNPPWSFQAPPVDTSLHVDRKNNISPSVFQKHFLETISSKYHDCVLCFTDGSKSDISTSCAYSIGNNILCSFRLNEVNNVFSSEIIAILLCLQNIKYLPPSKFLLVSDSMSAIQAIANICSSYKNSLTSKIYSAWKDLKACGKEVTLMWCPSHCGISGNEAVDTAAKNPTTPVQPLKLCSASDFKPIVAKIIHNMWQTSWNNLVIPNKLKRIKPVIENWTSSNRNTRLEEVVLTRLRIGHTRLTHSYLFTKSPHPTCRCGEPLTVAHILICPLDTPIRSLLPNPPSLSDDKPGVDSLMSYLRSLNIIDKI
ncbi:hypothetical protein M8J77_026283 [Diaphorina citri]|nr:hypothetical protein M8J77_026283 [Diaphorina citri]